MKINVVSDRFYSILNFLTFSRVIEMEHRREIKALQNHFFVNRKKAVWNFIEEAESLVL